MEKVPKLPTKWFWNEILTDNYQESSDKFYWEDKNRNVRGRTVRLTCNCFGRVKSFCPLHCKNAMRPVNFPVSKNQMDKAAKAMNTTGHGFRRGLALSLRREHEARIKDGKPGLKTEAVAACVGWGVSKNGNCAMWAEYTADWYTIDIKESACIPITAVLKEIEKLSNSLHFIWLFLFLVLDKKSNMNLPIG